MTLYSRCHLPSNTTVVPDFTSSRESGDAVWPDLAEIYRIDRVEQPRRRISSGMPPDLDIAKDSHKTVPNISSDNHTGNDTASDATGANQYTVASSCESNHPEDASMNSHSNSENRFTATSSVKIPETDPATDPQEAKTRSAPREAPPMGFGLETLTAQNLLGQGRHGRVHAVKFIWYGESVKQRILEVLKASEVPEDYRVAAKIISWKGAQCVCQDCDILKKLRRRKGLATCRSFLPHHLLDCKTSRIFLTEFAALRRLFGVPGIQQLIACAWSETRMHARLISKCFLF
jgi:hypothetical protein